jgi:tetratricopeptide (TPR) repeat protein
VLEIAEIQQDIGRQASAIENLGKIDRRRNRLDEAESHYRRAIALYTALGGDAGALGVARQYGQLGLVARMRGACQEALELHERAEQIFYKQLDIEGIAKQHSRKGKVYQAMGDLARAEEHFREALDAEIKLGIPRNIAVVAGHLTSNYLLQGKLELAEEPLRLCLEHNQAAGDSWGLATCDRYRGWIELERGNAAEARRYLEQAEQAYRRMGILRDLDDARALLARLK